MRSRHTVHPLLALAVAGLAACGADAEADSRPEATSVPTVALADLAELDQLTTTPPPTDAPAPEPLQPLDVAIVGDSLTVSAQEEITAALGAAAINIVALDAVEGRRTVAELEDKPSGLSAVEDIAAQYEPDVWVIALGTNDVGGQAEPERFREDVAALLAKVPAGAPVIWVDMWIEGRIEGCRELNAVLRDVAAGRSDMTVVDWFQFGDDPGLIIGDGVHLSDTGQVAFAGQIAAALAATRQPTG